MWVMRWQKGLFPRVESCQIVGINTWLPIIFRSTNGRCRDPGHSEQAAVLDDADGKIFSISCSEISI